LGDDKLKPYYEDKWIKIFHGDCREILPSLDVKFDLMLTDPPYDISTNICNINGDRKYLRDIEGKGMGIGFDISILSEFTDYFCFCGKQQLIDILNISKDSNWMIITWCKTNPTPLTQNTYLPDTEYIVHKFSKGRLFGDYAHKSRFYLSPNAQNDFNHPTVKPVALIQKLITLGSQESELILDPFLGSGTTCYCAKKLNRYSVGIELEEKYCEIAAKRCSQEVMELNI
jgi:site-specific DNA-methyltransferase (adenine-specific)